MRILISPCLLFIFVISANSQTHTFQVSVSVSADEVVRSQVSSSINSGLRGLGDIALVSERDANYHLSIVVIANTFNGRTAGYTLSIVITKNILPPTSAPKALRSLAKDAFSGDVLVDMFASGTDLIHHTLLTDSDLPSICKRAVADIDTGAIEEERKGWQKINKPPQTP